MGDEAGPSSAASTRRALTLTPVSAREYLISEQLQLDGAACGSWQQTMTIAAQADDADSTTALRGGTLRSDVGRCAQLLNDKLGPTDTTLVSPMDRLEYDATTDRITYWLVPSRAGDPDQVWPGPYYLWRDG